MYLLEKEKKSPIEGSYTNKLLENKNLAKDKVLEEVNELIEAVEENINQKYIIIDDGSQIKYMRLQMSFTI